MTQIRPQPLILKPGIIRDGTRLSAQGYYYDGLWTRFSQGGRPKKMGGYRQMTSSSDGIARSFENYYSGGLHYLHIGSNTNLRRSVVTTEGSTSVPSVRTPGGYTMQGDELWQLDTIYDPIIGNAATVIAHPGRNLDDISSDEATSIYYGAAKTTDAFAELTGIAQVSGGICVVRPYLTFFGSNGYFGWTGPNKINSQAVLDGGGEAWPAVHKIVAGRPVRGGNGPSAIYWTLNGLIRTSYIGGTATWAFDTVTDEASIMSSRSMATLGRDVWYWMGLDCFYRYDGGGVTELPNLFNSDFVFDNLNLSNRQKVFAFPNRRFGEIWFCFPYGDATECTHAVIYNERLNIWYDTELPGGGRSGALNNGIYPRPILGGVDGDDELYPIFEHEIGTDWFNGTRYYPIRAYIETSDLTNLISDQPANATITVHGVEADIKQAGDMTLVVTGNANARSSAVEEEPVTISVPPSEEAGQIARVKAERRQMRFRWETNTTDGNFEIGTPIAHLGVGSRRETG